MKDLKVGKLYSRDEIVDTILARGFKSWKEAKTNEPELVFDMAPDNNNTFVALTPRKRYFIGVTEKNNDKHLFELVRVIEEVNNDVDEASSATANISNLNIGSNIGNMGSISNNDAPVISQPAPTDFSSSFEMFSVIPTDNTIFSEVSEGVEAPKQAMLEANNVNGVDKSPENALSVAQKKLTDDLLKALPKKVEMFQKVK